jgi:hypothetical protein
MSVSRRRFVTDASALGLIAALLPELAAAQVAGQAAAPQAPTADTPHDSYAFWNGFFDSVNPTMNINGQPVKARGAADQLPDPAAETQYLHYNTDVKQLRYATDIGKGELLDHAGDVAVSIALSQFRPGSADSNVRASQLRVDTTQIYPLMNILAPLAWTSIASLTPTKKTGKIPSLDQLGFQSPQATQGSSNILFTQGAGKLAVNVSKAGEDRTRFLLSGNLTTAVATQQALANNELEARHIGLLSADYLMVPQRHVADLAKELPNLLLEQGYLVHSGADQTQPLPTRAESTLPGVTYATMRINVKPVNGCSTGKSASA